MRDVAAVARIAAARVRGRRGDEEGVGAPLRDGPRRVKGCALPCVARQARGARPRRLPCARRRRSSYRRRCSPRRRSNPQRTSACARECTADSCRSSAPRASRTRRRDAAPRRCRSHDCAGASRARCRAERCGAPTARFARNGSPTAGAALTASVRASGEAMKPGRATMTDAHGRCCASSDPTTSIGSFANSSRCSSGI